MDSNSMLFIGKESMVKLPSGREATIRETNGEDDAILSKLGDVNTGDSLMNFLANIVVKDSLKVGGSKVNVEDIKGWPSSDMYYLFYKQRLINRGDKLEFEYVCQLPTCPSKEKGELPFPVEQDLNEFDGDLDDPDYKPKWLGQVRKYPYGPEMQVEFEIAKTKMRFDIMTGNHELSRMKIPVDDHHKNTSLTVRNFSIFEEGTWVLITNFAKFPSKVMSQIRKMVETSDPLFEPKVKFFCPTCKTPYTIPLMNMPAFFWPEETI